MAKKKKTTRKKTAKKKPAKKSSSQRKHRFSFAIHALHAAPVAKSKSASLSAPMSAGLDSDLTATESFANKTGRVMLVTQGGKPKDSGKQLLSKIKNVTGLGGSFSKVCRSSDFKSKAIAESDSSSSDVIFFDEFGIAILNNVPSEQRAISSKFSTTSTHVLDQGFSVEQERINYSMGSPCLAYQAQNVYMPRGQVFNQPFAPMAPSFQTAQSSSFFDTPESTWGLKASNVLPSSLTGAGIKVAIIDSGFDMGHPDFAGRSIETFVNVPTSQPDQGVHDIVGHGTHCAGTACGPRTSGFGPRYGVATAADLFVAKVMFHHPQKATGVGYDEHILDGIRMALEAGSHIVSLSLGSSRDPWDPPFSQAYENVAAMALEDGQLLIAATGNDSKRHWGIVREVGGPANCPSVVGVAAVDSHLQVATFSNGRAGNAGVGAEVNLSSAGVQVHSSLPIQPVDPSLYPVPNRRTETFTGKWDGTSMATPHVSGIAALVAEETGLRGLDLYREMRSRARNIGHNDDYGHGLCVL